MVPKSGSANYIYQYRLLPLREVGAMILHPPLSSLGQLVPIYFWNICTQVQLKAVIDFQLEMFCHFVSNMFSCCLHYFTKRSYIQCKQYSNTSENDAVRAQVPPVLPEVATCTNINENKNHHLRRWSKMNH